MIVFAACARNGDHLDFKVEDGMFDFRTQYGIARDAFGEDEDAQSRSVVLHRIRYTSRDDSLQASDVFHRLTYLHDLHID